VDPELINLFEIVITLFAAFIAFVQHTRANGAIIESEQSKQTTRNVLNFFDQTDDTVPVAPPEVPGRSFKMSDESKRWITSDRSSEERESLLRQVAEAESKRLGVYQISVPSVWYNIEYGVPLGSGGSGKGVPT